MRTQKIVKTLTAGTLAVTGFMPTATGVLAQETEEEKNQTTNIPEAVETITDTMLELDQKIMDAKEDMDNKEVALENAQNAYVQAQQAEVPYQEAYNTASNQFDATVGSVNDQISAELQAQIAKLEETQKEIDKMTSQKSSYEDQLSKLNKQKEEAQALVEQLQAQYDEAKELADSLTPEDVENARLALEQAKQNLLDLEENINTLSQEIQTAQGQIAEKQNEIPSLTEQANALYTTWQNAAADRQQAESDYNALVAELESLQDPDAAQELQQQLAEAQNTLTEKQNAEATALSNYQAAQSATQTAQNELKTAQQTVTEKQDAYDKANEAYQTQLSTVTDLEAEVNEYETAAEEAYTKYQNALSEVSRLNGLKSEAEKSLEGIQSQITSINNQIASLEESLENAGNIDEEVADTMKGFFQYLGDEKALAILEDANGMSLEDLKTSLEYIQECNDLRAQESLDPLKVNSQLMALAYVQAQRSLEIYKEDGMLQHTGTDPHVGENLAIDGANVDPYGGWYDTEKRVYEYLQEHGLEEKDLTDDDKARIADELGIDVGMVQVGHYLNIVTPTYQNSGFAIIPYKIEYAPGYYFEMRLFGQTFSNGSYYALDSMTLQDYLSALENYEKAISGSSSEEIQQQIDALKAQLQQLQGQETGINDQISGYDTQIQAQQAIQSDNYDTYMKNNTLASSAQQKVDEAKEELSSLEKAKDDAYTALSDAVRAKETKQQTLTEKQGEEATALNNYQTAQNETKSAQKTVNQINYTIENLDSIIEEKTEEKNELETVTIPALKTEESEAQKAYDTKNGEITQIEGEIDTLKAEIETKNKTIISLNEQKPDLEAKANTAQETYDLYVKVTNPQELAEMLQKVEDASQTVTDIDGGIQKTNQDLATVEATLKTATETQATQASRKTLLESLQKEFDAIASGEEVTLLQRVKLIQSEDAFVQSIQAQYPTVQNAYQAMMTAKADLEKMQSLTHAAKEQVEKAQADYDSAKATYDALIQEMNDLINDSLEEEQPSDQETSKADDTTSGETKETSNDSSSQDENVDTAVVTGSAAAFLGLGGSALAFLAMERKKRNAKK